MSRPEFENQVSIAAVTSKKIKWVTKESTVPLAPNTFDRHTFFSPAKTVSRIINMQMIFGGLAAGFTGTREMILDSYLDNATGVGVFNSKTSDLTSDFMFDQGAFKLGYNDYDNAGVDFMPNDINTVNYNIRELRFDDIIGITFVYRHSVTGQNLTERRKMIYFVEEEVIA